MKKLLKLAFIGIGFCVIVAIVGAAMGSKNNEPSTKMSSPNTQQPATSKISQENFDKIKTGDAVTGDGGMSVDQVKAILGEPNNDVTSTSSINGKDYRMDSMTWTSGLEMKSITVTFINGFASSKGMMK